MKKHLTILFLSLILLLTACSPTPSTPTQEPTIPPTQEPTTPPTQEPIDETEAQYQLAVSLFTQRDWPAAIDTLSEIPDYRDSTVLIDAARTMQAQEASYAEAAAYFQSNQFREAALAFEAAATYQDAAAQAQAAWYQEGIAQERANNSAAAAIAFGKAGDYLDAEPRSFALWDKIAVRKTFDAKSNFTLMIKEDGSLIYTWNPYSAKNYTDLYDVVALSYGLCLRKDGTVVALDLSYGADADEPLLPLSHDIVSIDGGLLRKDGTVLQCDDVIISTATTSGLTDIIAISGNYTLDMDGTIHYVGVHDEFWEGMEPYITEWNQKYDFVAISNRGNWFAAVTTDGKVCASHLARWSFVPHKGWNNDGQYTDHLDENGMVIGWDNVVGVSVSIGGGGPFIVALHSDGTVSAIGNNHYGQCNVENWTDIVAIDTGDFHTVGMKSDGTIVAVGANHLDSGNPLCFYYEDFRGQCEVAGLKAKTDTSFVSPNH